MQIKKPLEFDTWFGSGLLFFAVQKEIVSEINKKSEPISNLENLVRIICVWCTRQESNLWPSESELPEWGFDWFSDTP